MSVAVSILAVFSVLGGALLIVNMSKVWAGDQEPLPAALIWLVNTAAAINRYQFVAAIGVAVASFALASLLSRRRNRRQ